MPKKLFAMTVVLLLPCLAGAGDTKKTVAHILAEKDFGMPLAADSNPVFQFQTLFDGVKERSQPLTDAKVGACIMALKATFLEAGVSKNHYQTTLYIDQHLPKKGKVDLEKFVRQLGNQLLADKKH